MHLRRLVGAITLSFVCFGQQARNAQQARLMAAWEYTPDPKLPNVLIIGDSISMGYTPPLREVLRGKANIFHPMRPDGKLPANCFYTSVCLTDLDKWLGSTKWSV